MGNHSKSGVYYNTFFSSVNKVFELAAIPDLATWLKLQHTWRLRKRVLYQDFSHFASQDVYCTFLPSSCVRESNR
jgi:hypothetical protein